MIYDHVLNDNPPDNCASNAPIPDPPDPRERLAILDSEILRVAGLSNAIDYQFINLLAEFDELGGWVGDGIKSFAHWLNWRCGMGALVAREKVRVARKLRKLPCIDAAFRQGEVGYTKVRAITRVANEKNEEYLLFIAKHGTTRHVENSVKRFNWCKHRDAMESGELDDYRKTSRLNWRQDEFGMVSIHACLPAEEAELIIKALDKMVDQTRRDDTEGHAEAESDVVAEREKSAICSGNNEQNSENVSRETFSAQPEEKLTVRDYYSNSRASALAHIAEHFLASESLASEGEANTLPQTDRYQVLLHINANAAHIDHKIEQGPCCYLDEGGFVSPEVARQLACAASVTTILEDDDGNVLNIGRRSRTPSRAISLAVQIRDKGCRFPNCHQTKHTDQHHIVHWDDGGETSEANLISLCRRHHSLLHKNEYTLEKSGHDVKFVDRLGKIIKRALYPQFPDSPSPADAIRQFDAECRKKGIEINKTTADCQWQGERMDDDMFIEAMYDLEKSD